MNVCMCVFFQCLLNRAFVKGITGNILYRDTRRSTKRVSRTRENERRQKKKRDQLSDRGIEESEKRKAMKQEVRL